jgi:hypothetical protein
MSKISRFHVWAFAVLICLAGCSSGPADEMLDAGSDLGFGPPPYVDGDSLLDASWKTTEGGFVVPEAGVIPRDRFITRVVSTKVGPCGGFSGRPMPEVVEGPPVGGGPYMGSTDVFSLGNGGEIVVAFGENEIVDGPGIDFIVFENPFDREGTTTVVDAEPAEVSVSEDGVNWTSFPCDDTTSQPPYQQCAGVHPVLSSPTNDISPIDPKTAGGDPYDLQSIGVKKAKYVRIVDKILETCPANAGPAFDKDGFDLDAISIVNASLP